MTAHRVVDVEDPQHLSRPRADHTEAPFGSEKWKHHADREATMNEMQTQPCQPIAAHELRGARMPMVSVSRWGIGHLPVRRPSRLLTRRGRSPDRSSEGLAVACADLVARRDMILSAAARDLDRTHERGEPPDGRPV